MKPGNLVTVLPHAKNVYVVIQCLEGAQAGNTLGALWELYGEERGFCTMRETFMELISENL